MEEKKITGDSPIEELDLSIRSYNALKRMDIKTVNDIFEKGVELKRVTPKLYDKVCEKLKDIFPWFTGFSGESTIEDTEPSNFGEVSYQYIPIADIRPHPKNPRKSVGDVSELAESIKSNGIMQNLTVIPDPDNDGKYMALIGHRRLAAAKLAGLETVPCLFAANLTEQEQIAIMLTENIHRAALTAMEEAEGIQMMLDLGDTVSDISEKTGMSETTIRRRRSLLDFDHDLVAAAQENGATLDDFEKIREIKDEKQREECLKAAGTSDFAYKLRAAKATDESNEKRERMLKWLDSWAECAEEKPSSDDYKCIKTISIWSWKESDEPCGENCLYTKEVYGGNYSIWRPKTDEEKREQKENNEKLEQARRKADYIKNKKQELFEMLKIIDKNHIDFIKSFSHMPKGHTFAESVMKFIMVDVQAELCAYDINETFDGDKQLSDSEFLEDIAEKSPEKAVLMWLYNTYSGSVTNIHYFMDYNGNFVEDETWRLKFIDSMRCFGYEPSTVEIEIYSGTHEIYHDEYNDEA